MSDLHGRVAVVTGGASGIGRAIAARLHDDGAGVIVTDIQAGLGLEFANESGMTFLEHDVTSEDSWRGVIREVEAQHGGPHVLVNNAGILGPSDAVTPEDTSLESWRSVFAVNVDGVFLGCKTVLPVMRRVGTGSIINVSSIAGLLATPYGTAYGCSKAAVRQLTQSVAQHCAEQRIPVRCNSLHPGNVRTPLWDRGAEERALRHGTSVEEEIEIGRRLAPMGEFVAATDIAAAAAFLASDESRQMTGSMMVVDGGSIYCSSFHMGLA